MLKSNPPYAIWSIWIYLPFLQRLLFLVVCLVCIYSIFSAAGYQVDFVRLRASLRRKTFPRFNGPWPRFINGVPTCSNSSELLFTFLASCFS